MCQTPFAEATVEEIRSVNKRLDKRQRQTKTAMTKALKGTEDSLWS